MRKSIFHTYTKIGLGIGALFLGLTLPAANSAPYPNIDQYRDCVRDVSIDARQAYDKAVTWRASGGGPSAMHCEALALSAMGVYPSAAKTLMRLAGLPEIEDPAQRADVYLQAGHAYLLAGNVDGALNAFASGLAHVDFEDEQLAASELHVARARAFGIKEEWAGAIKELDVVLAVLPQHDEALLVRASMHRADGDPGACAVDLVNYLTLWPDDPYGLLERGLLMLDVLNVAGAKSDFERVVELAPESPAAARALTALAKLRFREENRLNDDGPE